MIMHLILKNMHYLIRNRRDKSSCCKFYATWATVETLKEGSKHPCPTPSKQRSFEHDAPQAWWHPLQGGAAGLASLSSIVIHPRKCNPLTAKKQQRVRNRCEAIQRHATFQNCKLSHAIANHGSQTTLKKMKMKKKWRR